MEHPWGALEIPGSWVSRGLRGRKKRHLLRSRLRCPRGTHHEPQGSRLGVLLPGGGWRQKSFREIRECGRAGLLPGWASPRGENIQGFTESAGVPHCLRVDICFPLSSPTAPLAGYPRVPRAAFGAAGAEGHFWNAVREGWDQQALPREQLALEKRGSQGHSCFLGSSECQDMGFI